MSPTDTASTVASAGIPADRLQRSPFELGTVLIFIMSGCAGLIYESVWTSYLGNFLGHAAYAQTLVLALFMGGLAIGAYLAGRRSERWRDPLKAYAIAEVLIALAALVFHHVFVWVVDKSLVSVIPSLGGPAAIQMWKWSIATVLVLPASILLGVTFPLMTAGVMRRDVAADGRVLSGLYFSNSLGAVAGALLATFVLVPALGLPGSLHVGAALNLAAAVGAWLLSASRTPDPPRIERPPVDAQGQVGRPTLIVAAAFLTGASSLAYEIGWIRMLNLVLGASVHAFELMLAAFIGGLAFGGLFVRKRIDGYRNALYVAGVVQILMGLAALATLPLYSQTFRAMAWMLTALAPSDAGYVWFNLGSSALALMIMFPAAFFAGMTLPLLTLAALRRGHGEPVVGKVYAFNTLGAIVGVLAMVHVLIPLMGLKLSMVVAAAVDLVLGIWLLRATRADSPRRAYPAAFAIAAVAVAAALLLVHFDPRQMASGVFRSKRERIVDEFKLLYQRDGKTASISFFVSPAGYATIMTNGKPDASIRIGGDGPLSDDEYTMTMAALLPLALHPAPRSAGVIGFGSGMTTHTLLGDDRLERVDTIEIEPAMVIGARGFGERVQRAFDDPRSHVMIEDAKTFFASNKARYDMIISEPSNPWVSGVGALFSQEFYRFVPHHLTEDGIFVQWVQLYEIDPSVVASIAKALSCCFADYRMFEGGQADLLIVASPHKPLPAFREDVFAMPKLQSDLQPLGLVNADEFELRWLGDREIFEGISHSYDIAANSDYYPLVSYRAPAMRFKGYGSIEIATLSQWKLPTTTLLAGRDWPLDRIGPQSAARVGQLGLTARRAFTSLTTAGAPQFVSEAIEIRRAVLGTRLGLETCTIAPQPSPFYADLFEVASVTVPYLPAAQQAELWSEQRWQHCFTGYTYLQAQLRLYRAIGTRDGAEMLAAGQALLQNDQARGHPELPVYASTAAMLGALLAGRHDEIGALQQRYAALLEGQPVWAFHQRLIQQVAVLRQQRGSAGTAPAAP